MTKSRYADRKTVGALALEARKFHTTPCVGDMGHELMQGLVEDLNNTIASNPFNEEPFYIIIHEKKDSMLGNAILRRMIVSKKRPFPEPNTIVFWTEPKSQTTKFCWSLPHQAHFPQYLVNAHKYKKEQIEDIKAYRDQKMEHFGFYKSGTVDTEKGKVALFKPIKNFKDRNLHNTPDVKVTI